jgi:microcephalin
MYFFFPIFRSETKLNNYTKFDVPHEEQDIITEEERKSPVKHKSIQDVMKNVFVYVQVRTGEDNRTQGIQKVISMLGAHVHDKIYK